MNRKTRSHGDDLRGASRLAVEATQGVASLVEAMHRAIGAGPAALGRPLEGPVALLTRAIYGQVRGVAGLVGKGIDVALAQLAPLLGEGVPGPDREALLSVVNGVLGDYLEASDNPLAIAMQLRHGGEPLDLEQPEALTQALTQATDRLLLMVHGSCMNDAQWLREGHDHGLALARDRGWTRIGAHYNSGLHVSTNGDRLAPLIQRLVDAWPLPLREIAVIGHSMGGLVSRSAIRVAEEAALPWRAALRALVTLGTPHHGAPLERAGNWVDVLLGVSRYSAPLAALGKIRSAGVTDLRFGNVLEVHWNDADRFAPTGDRRVPVPLPSGVACYAVAGTLDTVLGDGLVTVDSALGIHPAPEQTLAFPADHTFIAQGTGHLELLHRPEVYARLRPWL